VNSDLLIFEISFLLILDLYDDNFFDFETNLHMVQDLTRDVHQNLNW